MKTKPETGRWVGGSPELLRRAPAPAFCASPFGRRLEPEAAHRILTSEGLRPHLAGRAPGILAAGFLPARTGGVCLFAEEGRCRVEAELGRAGLPDDCRRFPLVAVGMPEGGTVVGVRRGGEGTERFEGRLGELRAAPVGARHGLSSGRTLSWQETEGMLAVWEDALRAEDPRVGLARAFGWTELVSAQLEASPADLVGALGVPLPEIALPRGVSLLARSFLASAFSGTSSGPSEVEGGPSRLAALARATSWFLGVGRVAVPGGGPVSFSALAAVPSPLSGPEAGRCSAYLRDALARRELFVRQTYLGKALVELAFALLVTSWSARAAAVRAGADACAEEHVEAGLVLGDAFLAAQLRGPSARVLEQVRGQLLGDVRAFSAFLAAA